MEKKTFDKLQMDHYDQHVIRNNFFNFIFNKRI